MNNQDGQAACGIPGVLCRGKAVQLLIDYDDNVLEGVKMANELIDFIVNGSVGDIFEFRNPELGQLLAISSGKKRFEKFCVECNEKKVFIYDGGLNSTALHNISNALSSTGSLTSMTDVPYEPLKQFNYMYIRFKCSLNESHKLEYFFAVRDNSIVKVGQVPSSADQDLPQAKKYSSILGKQYYAELKRAIGLYSHKVGIGSFVYLRRIIEKLVYDAFKDAEAAGSLTYEQFETHASGKRRNTVEEKIKLLKGFLPELITENTKIYGIVSKGIHELSEEECMKYFPILKGGIIMILDEIAAKKEKEKSEAEYREALGSIVSELTERPQ